MSRVRLLGLGVLITGLLSGGLTAQAGDVKLEWKAFEGKDPFYQKVKTVTTQKMKVQGQQVDQKQDQTFWFSWTPKAKDKDGNFVVVQKILGIKMDMEIGGNKISVNTTDDKAPKNPMTQFFDKLKDQEFTLTIGLDKDKKRYEVKDVEGVDKFVEKLNAVAPQMKPVLDKIMGKDAIKELTNPILQTLPDEGKVPEKKKWERESKLSLGPIGSYDNKYFYESVGPDKDKKDLHVIKVQTSMKYNSPKGDDLKVLPFKILDPAEPKDALKADEKESGGELRFNTVSGWIEKSTLKTVLKGQLRVEIASMTLTVDVDQTQDVAVETSKDNLVGK